MCSFYILISEYLPEPCQIELEAIFSCIAWPKYSVELPMRYICFQWLGKLLAGNIFFN